MRNNEKKLSEPQSEIAKKNKEDDLQCSIAQGREHGNFFGLFLGSGIGFFTVSDKLTSEVAVGSFAGASSLIFFACLIFDHMRTSNDVTIGASWNRKLYPSDCDKYYNKGFWSGVLLQCGFAAAAAFYISSTFPDVALDKDSPKHMISSPPPKAPCPQGN